MTVLDAITKANKAKRNNVPFEKKIQWLEILDGEINKELRQVPGELPPYNVSTDLLVPKPYCDIYPAYLVMRIDLELEDLEHYNGDALCFNKLLQSLSSYCKRKAARGEEVWQ